MHVHGSMWCHEPARWGSSRPSLPCCWWRAAARWSTGAPSSRCPDRARRSSGRPCKAADVRLDPCPAGAECGMLSVPVDYAKPDGDVAQIAMIRFKATGEKIGSLVDQPRRSRRVRCRGGRVSMVADAAAVGARAVRPRRLRSARRRATPRPRCGATPTRTTTGCAPTPRSTTRRRASRTSRTRPRRSSSAASTRWARSSWPTSEPPTWPRISTRSAPHSATRS